MQISFLGAAGTVTGSKYLLKINGKKVLIDCGLFQGRKELRERNWAKLPIEPSKIDAVILTHAHLDHSGYLPLLVKNGFTGPIYSTQGTKELCSILLPDSGYIQEEDAYFANKYGFSKHKPALPLYTEQDAEKVMDQFITIPFEKNYPLYDDCHFIFSRSAHILGSAFIRLTYQSTTITFSGDLGRMRDPIMREPASIDSTDYLVVESTYGDRLHDAESPENQLANVINETIGRGGVVVIPAFAVGRTQGVLYYISRLKEEKRIPHFLPVYLDSPMAESVTNIYARYVDEHRLALEHCARLDAAATYITTPDESKKIDTANFPAIIISASGMATGGRVLHHLKTFASDDRNTILFTGYQADGTLGDRIVKGAREVKIHGGMVPIRAEIRELSNFSAHADYSEILEWLSHFKKAPRNVFITHGESEAALSLKHKIEERFGWRCLIPQYLQEVDL